MWFYWKLKFTIFWQLNIHINGWSLVLDRPLLVFPLTTNYFNFCFVFLNQGNLIFCVLLIFGLNHFFIRFQIQPQLIANGSFFRGKWHLCMDYTLACCHPLKISWTYCTFMPFKILMMKLTAYHVSYSLKSSMWMIRKSCRQFYMEKIQHEERIKSSQMLVTNNPYNSSPFSFVLPSWLEDQWHWYINNDQEGIWSHL